MYGSLGGLSAAQHNFPLGTCGIDYSQVAMWKRLLQKGEFSFSKPGICRWLLG